MRVKQIATRVLAMSSLCLAGSVGAQSILDHARLWLDPNEFVLNSAAEKEMVEFDYQSPVRVCLGDVDEAQIPTMEAVDAPNDTPLRIERSLGRTIILEAGTCVDFVATTIELSPVGAIEDGWSLHGTIQTLESRG